MEFWTTEPRVNDAIEAMPGYAEGNWTQLKKDLITKWGRVEPEKRYRKDSLIKLFNDTQEDGGIGSLSQYKKFMGEYETIVTYSLRYRYIAQDNMFHEDLFDCLSSYIKGAITNEPLFINYGLRNTKEKYSRAENTNQDVLRSHPKVKTPIKKRQNIPGAYIDDEQKGEEKTIIPTKYKKPQLVQNENYRPSQEPKIDHTKNTQESIKKVNERKITKEEKLDLQEIMAQILKRVLEQKRNLTLKQILVMSPKFFNQLKNVSEEEKKSINSIDTKETQTKLIYHHLGNYEQPKLHHACPLGFMKVYLGEEGHEMMALVDTGSELNILPEDSAIKEGLNTRCLSLNLRGIGGHCTSIVGLAEFSPITLVTGEERNIHPL
ncbi:hypothetical protein O181_023201 [Austropuccinia psidii MF-1]|uniref:Peptidase A2 domain-containing protein n=1 Tax=Austropuccinia psidii MF-1 TaxID=1389203 RepID=A0A9Q3CIX9_9BASI|nr:hypothetical protein [Austropuccinia psidii MF-1]